jgi:hypothetical protein
MEQFYSHVIYNPNKITLNNDNCHVIPSGTRCTSAMATKVALLRSCSLPFDWTVPLYPKKIKNILHL